VGNCEKVKVAFDAWVGSGDACKVHDNFIFSLQRLGIYNLAQATNPNLTTIWKQEWKFSYLLGLEGLEGEKWEAYIEKLKISLIGIRII
jgi:hypothetical protein